MKKVLLVFGTRPEAIKMAPLVNKMSQDAMFETSVCVTGQHREMLDQVLRIFDIRPDFDLDIMRAGQDLFDVSTAILSGLKTVIQEVEPDLVLVHGDTATTFAASLAAYYCQVKLGHVEAGLRTYDLFSPWPEEGNRQLTGVLANYHFAPTDDARKNLVREGHCEGNIVVTGNTVIDALLLALDKIENSAQLKQQIEDQISKCYKLNATRRFILVTGHRRENFGEGFLNICQALKELALSNPNIDIVYPVHLNPNVQRPVKDLLSEVTNIYLIDPLQYESFIYLMSRCYLLITDSGGVQEEAPSLGKPVLLMRDTTERPEAVAAGTVKLVGTDASRIVEEAQALLDNQKRYAQMSCSHNPYGDGNACEHIVRYIKTHL